MDKEQIIRAWKDAEYRAGLSPAELAALPEHPAGVTELSDPELEEVGGATWALCTIASLEVSCVPVYCANTLWSGSCHFQSLGCCHEIM